MNIERMTKAADFLENLSERRKELNYGVEIPKHFSLKEWYQRRDCGTTACAIGHMMLHPTFYEDGLKFTDGSSDVPAVRRRRRPVPSYNGASGLEKGWDAVVTYFDITRLQAEYLFSPGFYENGDSTPAGRVAERIRKVMTNGFAPPPWDERRRQ